MGNSSSKGPPIDEQCLAPWGVYPELQWDKPTAKAVKKLILDREMRLPCLGLAGLGVLSSCA